MALTKEQKQSAFDELAKFIEAKKDDKGKMMPIMQQAQKLFGCVSLEVQEFISAHTGVSVAEIYGIATFYAQFTLEPKGDNVVSVCQGTACYVKGGAAVLEEVKKILGINAGQTTPDGKFSIQDTRCLGCCGLAPVMTINDDVYGRLTPKEVKGILDKYMN